MTEEINGGSSARKGSALKAMVSFFTIWHMDIVQEDIDEMERKFHLAPMVGALLGVILLIETTVMVYACTNGFGNPSLVAALILATVYIGSKFLHFDGLADFGDGMIVSSGKREDHVRALKDTLVGAGGMGVALTTVILAFALYSCLGVEVWIIAVPAAVEVFVKVAMVAAAAYGTPGNGMAGRQVAMTTTDSVWKASILGLVLSFLLILGAFFLFNMATDIDPRLSVMDALFPALIGVLTAIVVGFLMARNANKTFGMVNGDILGATNEIARVSVLFVLLVYLAVI